MKKWFREQAPSYTASNEYTWEIYYKVIKFNCCTLYSCVMMFLYQRKCLHMHTGDIYRNVHRSTVYNSIKSRKVPSTAGLQELLTSVGCRRTCGRSPPEGAHCNLEEKPRVPPSVPMTKKVKCLQGPFPLSQNRQWIDGWHATHMPIKEKMKIFNIIKYYHHKNEGITTLCKNVPR